jgi:hypothetical protein
MSFDVPLPSSIFEDNTNFNVRQVSSSEYILSEEKGFRMSVKSKL